MKSIRKHLHGRGEDLSGSSPTIQAEETPPRTWRRLVSASPMIHRYRNTSTDVEKTPLKFHFRRINQKHLHGRGEDRSGTDEAPLITETPPRTWRRPFRRPLMHQKRETPPRTWRRPRQTRLKGESHGNTSTDVEKTRAGKLPRSNGQKHLHGRGEDSKI